MEDSVSKVMLAVQSRKVVAIVRGFDAEVCLKLAEAAADIVAAVRS